MTQFTAIDFETGCGRRDSACSVALCTVTDGEITSRFSNLICPPDPDFDFEMINIGIHGITPGMVRNEPTFDLLWPQILPLLEDHLVVAHSASFDISVLRALVELYKLDCPDFDYTCTCQMARKVFPDLPDHKLDTVADHLDIPLKHHDAESDAEASAKIAIDCANRENVQNPGLICGTKSFRK